MKSQNAPGPMAWGHPFLFAGDVLGTGFFKTTLLVDPIFQNRQGLERKICGEEKVGFEKNNLRAGEKSPKFSVRTKYKTRKNVLVKIWKTEKSQNQLCQLFEKIRKSARTPVRFFGGLGSSPTSRFRICSTNALLATS